MSKKVFFIFIVLLQILQFLYTDFYPVPQFGDERTHTMAWADFDNDGDLDMAVGNGDYNTGKPNFLFINQLQETGELNFICVQAFGNQGTKAMAWGDYDNDGDLDLAVGNGYRNSEDQNKLYINKGSGNFQEQDQFGLNRTRTLAWADFNNDGYLDLAVGNGNDGAFGENKGKEPNFIYVNDGNGNFQKIPLGSKDRRTNTLIWGYFDNNHYIDLAEGNFRKNELYLNLGSPDSSISDLLYVHQASSAAWGDYDNDGDLDLVSGISVEKGWHDYYLFINEYINNTPLFYEEVASTHFKTATRAVAWGDYDNDGDLDLAAGKDGLNYLYINRDNKFYAEPAFNINPEEGEPTTCVAWGDCDNDGDLDMAVANNGQNYLFINDENNQNYIRIHLAGQYEPGISQPYSNRDGIGARIYLYNAGKAGNPSFLTGLRLVESNRGKNGQDSIDAEFGIPVDCQSVSILVRWPGSKGDRITEYWDNIEKTQFLTLHEGTGIPYSGTNLY